MGYTSFEIKEDKKNKRWRVTSTQKNGSWEGGGNFLDLYPVSGVLVAMKFSDKPVAVYKDLEHACNSIEKEYGIRPTIQK